MNVASATASIWDSLGAQAKPPSIPGAIKAAQSDADGPAGDEKLRDAFQSFVGETLFGQMLKSMRKTQNEPAYFHGGRGEEMFQQQLDQVLAEKMASADGGKFSDAMYDLFTMKRS